MRQPKDLESDVREYVRQRKRDGQSFVTLTHLKHDLGLTPNEGGRVLKHLEREGDLERWSGNSCSTYQILLDERPQLVADGGER